MNASRHDTLDGAGALRVVLVVSGAVDAVLIPTWVLQLRHARHWDIRCVLTRAASTFTTKRALAALSGNPAYDDDDWCRTVPTVLHKELASWGDILVVAPATVNLLSAIDHMRGQTLAETVIAHSESRTFVLPSVSGPVTGKPAYRALLSRLAENGLEIVEPAGAPVSIGDSLPGEGGMPTLQDLDEAVNRRLAGGRPTSTP